MSIAVVARGDSTGGGACPPLDQAVFFARKSFFASSRLRLQPRSARRSFCMNVGIVFAGRTLCAPTPARTSVGAHSVRPSQCADDIFDRTMSQDRLEASLDIDRLPAVDVLRI